MRKLYKNIGLALGVLFAVSCSDDTLQESPSLIPVNPNPGAEQLPPNEQWAWVGAYPGEVSNSIQRLSGVEVKVKGDYQAKDLKLVSRPGYLQSSGLYVPPAEEVVINYPGGASNLHYQIGIASWELPSGGKYSRFEKVYAEGTLIPGENRVHTNFGGHLYFYYEGEPQGGEVTLTVDGAVKSVDYILDETNIAEWRNAVIDSVSPMIWGELVGKKIIMTLPVSVLKQIERPDVFLKFFDEILEKDMAFFGGMDGEQMSMPWRFYSDVQLPNDLSGKPSSVYPYYPMGYLSNTSDSLDNILLGLSDLGNTKDIILLQGFAGLYSMNWSSSDYIGSQLQKLPVFRLYQRRGRWHDVVPAMVEPIEPEERIHMPSADDKMPMLVQLVQQYGWDLLSYTAKKCREEIPADVPDQYKNDLLAIYASEYAGADLTGFFEAWAFPLSAYSRNYMKHYPAPPTKFWQLVSTEQPKEGEGARGTAYAKESPQRDTLYDTRDWSITASSSHGEGPIERLIDGNMTSYWHSDWSDDSKTYPHTVEINFPEPVEFNYLFMVQRNDGARNGNPGPKDFEILYKTEADSENWIEYQDGRLFKLYNDYKATAVQKIFLDEPITAYGVKIMYMNCYGRGDDASGGTVSYTAMAELGIGLLK